jgi:phage baseplate assembly protein W
MSSTGVHRDNGTALHDFEHVRQSIGDILTTPVGSRVLRRDYGSELFDLIDRPMTDRVILAVYAAAVIAIARWEPRYAITGCRVAMTGGDGVIALAFNGTYFPRGHLGDFTPAGDQRVIIPIRGGVLE